jgi:hypothetical protein
MLIYYGLSQFDIVQTGWMNDRPFWLLFRDATFCATLALVLNTAAYVAELLAGMMVTFRARSGSPGKPMDGEMADYSPSGAARDAAARDPGAE